jgi:hypothetical protein
VIAIAPSTLSIAAKSKPAVLEDHALVPEYSVPGVRFEKRPAKTPDGAIVTGLDNAWIVFDNPSQFNSYTTEMAKGAIMAFRAASAAPALKVDGRFVANPVVVTDRHLDEFGRIIHGEPKTGAALAEGKRLLARGTVDLSLLDEKVEQLCAKLLLTFPECLTKSFEELRKPEAWNRNKENSRAWLALNMMTEARAGFRAFNEGPRDHREIDFVALRQLLANGAPWTENLIENLIPKAGNSR